MTASSDHREGSGAELRPSQIQSLHIDEVGLLERAAELGSRSLKRETKLAAIQRAVSMIDLTTLEGSDSVGRVRSLCRKALDPAPGTELPPVAAVCVYPRLVPVAVEELAGTPVSVASVSSGFPAGQVPLAVKLEDTRFAVESGADEIDVVIARGDFLRGDHQRVHDEIAALKEAAGSAHLKVILETGELGSFENIARAAWIACEAGADFIKTSTGKVALNSTPATCLCMLRIVGEYERRTGRRIGVKVAGGIRTARQALHYLVLVHETLGESWLSNRWFRIGASSLLNDLIRQWITQTRGSYVGRNDFSTD